VSLQLLQSVGLKNSVLAGDTRFDRVNQIVKQGEEISIAKNFKGNQKVFVVGSCWQEDLDVLIPWINEKQIKIHSGLRMNYQSLLYLKLKIIGGEFYPLFASGWKKI